MKIMAGIDTDFTGEAWPGEGITVGYLAQEPELDPAKTVKENVMDGVRGVADMMERFNEISTLMADRSEEHTSELQSLMRISYAVFCLKKKKTKTYKPHPTSTTNQTIHPEHVTHIL